MRVKRSTQGETDLTACVWRVDPKADHPKIEIFAHGLRNMWGFCWDKQGRMWGTENGPNAEAPEEMNLIELNHHYGFPYVFSLMDHKLYPDQPDAPKGLAMTAPVVNDGPDAGAGLGTFENHSCPSGIIQLGAPFPEEHRGAFLVTRFGNFLGSHDVGFDVLEVRVHEPADSDGRLHASVTTFLKPIGRCLDLHPSGGKIFISEFSRSTRNDSQIGLPGRIWELSADQP